MLGWEKKTKLTWIEPHSDGLIDWVLEFHSYLWRHPNSAEILHIYFPILVYLINPWTIFLKITSNFLYATVTVSTFPKNVPGNSTLKTLPCNLQFFFFEFVVWLRTSPPRSSGVLVYADILVIVGYLSSDCKQNFLSCYCWNLTNV